MNSFSPNRSSRKSPISPVISQLMRKDKELSQLRDEITSLSVAAQHTNHQIKTLTNELRERDRYIDQLHSNQDQLEQDLQDMDTTLKQMKKEGESRCDSLQRIISDRDKLIAQQQKQMSELKDAQRDPQRLKEEIQIMNLNTQKHQMQIKILESEVLQREQTIVQLQNAEGTNRQQITQLEKMVQDQEKKVEDQQQEIRQGCLQIEQLTQQVQSRNEGLEQQLLNQIHDLQHELKYQCNRIKDHDVESMQQIHLQAQTYIMQIRLLEQELATKSSYILQLENTLHEKNGRLEQVEQSIKESSGMFLEHQRIVDAQNRQIQELLYLKMQEGMQRDPFEKHSKSFHNHHSTPALDQTTKIQDYYKNKSKRHYDKRVREFEIILEYIFEVSRGYSSILEDYSLNRQGENDDIATIVRQAYVNNCFPQKRQLVLDKNPSLKTFIQRIECLITSIYNRELDLQAGIVKIIKQNKHENAITELYPILLDRGGKPHQQDHRIYKQIAKDLLPILERSFDSLGSSQITKKVPSAKKQFVFNRQLPLSPQNSKSENYEQMNSILINLLPLTKHIRNLQQEFEAQIHPNGTSSH